MQNKFKVFTTITIIVLAAFFLFGFSEHARHIVFHRMSLLNYGTESNFTVIPSSSLPLISPSNSTASELVKSRLSRVDMSDNASNNITGIQCPNVLKYMTYGKWKPRKVSRDEVKKMELFLLKSRNQYGIPASLQRQDGKCGNISFDNPKLSWFRPLCDPNGPSPCCYNGACAIKSIENCVCKNCYDMRTSINAEHADWIPSHKHCQVPSRTGNQLCQFIDGLTIYFMGDSFIRHIYLAFILLLKENLIDGAMKSSTPKGISGFVLPHCPACRIVPNCTKTTSKTKLKFSDKIRNGHLLGLGRLGNTNPTEFLCSWARCGKLGNAAKRTHRKEMHDECTGYYMFTEKQCRSLLEAFPVVCSSRVNLQFFQFQSSVEGSQIQNIMIRSNDPKTYFIVGTGVHDNFNTTTIWNRILLPVLQQSNILSTRLLWHAAHAPGLLKTPFVPTQGYDRAIEFNKEMKTLLQQYKVPIFESFNFTDGVNSFDGAHFGQGVNLLKARIIFEYFRELKENGKVQ